MARFGLGVRERSCHFRDRPLDRQASGRALGLLAPAVRALAAHAVRVLVYNLMALALARPFDAFGLIVG